jgi:hypothetical protein
MSTTRSGHHSINLEGFKIAIQNTSSTTNMVAETNVCVQTNTMF